MKIVQECAIALMFGQQSTYIPSDSKVIHFAHHMSQLRVWFECDPSKPYRPRFFQLIATGHDVPDGFRYIGTVTDPQNLYSVFHLYEKIEEQI